MTADQDKIEKVVRIIAEARAMGVDDAAARRSTRAKIDFTVVYSAPRTRRQEAARRRRERGKCADPLRPEDPLRPRRDPRRRRVGARGDPRGARARAGRSRSLRLRPARRRAAREQGRASRRSCSAARSTRRSRRAGITRARAFAAIDRALERVAQREQGSRARADDPLRPVRRAAPRGRRSATSVDEYPQRRAVGPARDARAREAVARLLRLRPPARSLRRASSRRFDVDADERARRAWTPWAKVRVAGMVEGYRERIFKGGGGKIAFFELEDTVGRVEVQGPREADRDATRAMLTSGEPVLVSGKVSFPHGATRARRTDGAPREPTLLLDEAVPLADAIRAETKQRRASALARRAHGDARAHRAARRRARSRAPGACPVQLVIELEDGAEAVLSLGRGLRVEPNDAMLARLEKLFGEKVAELR